MSSHIESDTYAEVKALASTGDVRVSAHGYEELAADGLSARELVEGIEFGIVLEDYPNFPKGRCVLVLQHDECHRPVHVVWGIPPGHERPAVLVTAYRPDPRRWDASLTKRLP
jgi:hypothetical protein